MLFEFKHITKRKPVPAANSSTFDEAILRDINFNITGREPLLILGPSGSGKTTLLRLFNRLADPDNGKIYFHGEDITSYDVCSLRTRVGYVSQVPIMIEGTVMSNFRYAVKYMKKNNNDISDFEDRCRELLRYLNVSENLLHHNAENLSVGEKQRVALARTLIRNPEVILLDEPTSALDPTATLRFLDTILQLQNETKLSIVMVTHGIEQAKIINGNALILVGGIIVEQGAVEKIINNPDSETTKKFIEGILDN